MPATARSTAAPELYHCYRCDKDKPADTAFYHHADGSIVSGCKECHGRMARERKDRRAKEAAQPASNTEQLALGIVADAKPTPAEARYRCEGCGKIAATAHPEGPRGWKRVRLTGREDVNPATLCVRCTATVTKAAGVVAAVMTRRNSGKGLRH
jgi:hypothetical protein